MTIRGKLRNLLLAATLSPLLISFLIFGLLLYGLGSHLAEDSKKYLVKQSHDYLKSLIRDADLLIQKDFQLIDWIVASQKHEIEQRLNLEAKAPPARTLDSLATVFQQLRKKDPGLILRQYLILPSGSSYVLSANNKDIVPFDLSDHKWLRQAAQKHDLIRRLVNDPLNQSLNLLIGIPLSGDDKTPRGITAVEISLDSLFLPLRLPETWQSGAKVLLVRTGLQTEPITIVAESSTGTNWQRPEDAGGLETVLSDVAAEIATNVKNHLPGVLMMEHKDKARHWAYGVELWDGLFPLVMIEHEQVVSSALESEQHILGKTKLGAIFVGLSLFVFSGLAILMAWHFSRTVTEPARELSNAFNQLAKGDFTVRVAIETGDEIEELGHNFNGLGGKLADRERMADSLALAREVQLNLLPSRPPVIAGIELFSRGIPCDEVGGDYYDFIEHAEQDKNILGIAVGDVTGHGAPAALLMASARGILRSHAWCHGGDLKFLFRLLNHHLTKDSAYELFMTLFYAVLDRNQRTLTWNSAGHGPVFLYRCRSQTLVKLEVSGPPLGIEDNLDFEVQEIDNLEPGDILLAGTDGLWECRNQDNEIWGVDNFKDNLLQVTAESAERIGTFLFAELKQFQNGQKQEDDISLVIAKIV